MTAHLTSVKMPITKKQKVTGVVDVGKKGPLYTAGGNVK